MNPSAGLDAVKKKIISAGIEDRSSSDYAVYCFMSILIVFNQLRHRCHVISGNVIFEIIFLPINNFRLVAVRKFNLGI